MEVNFYTHGSFSVSMDVAVDDRWGRVVGVPRTATAPWRWKQGAKWKGPTAGSTNQVGPRC